MDDVELPFLGTEPLVVEFANTRYGDQDFLDHAALWFTTAGLRLPRDLAATRALRDSVHALFTAAVDATKPPARAIAHVNAVVAPTTLHLTRHPDGTLTASTRPTTTGDAALLGDLATACITLLTDPRPDARPALLRRCDAPDCCLFFVQHHPRRRYCHESCAHRDRQSRYYRRTHP